MRSRAVLLAGVLSAVVGAAAHGQPFPSKPVRVVVPFPAGGTTDIVARLVGQRMSESMGQPVLVENKGGAGGQIGAAEVAKSAPDGYTILIHNVTFPMASVAAALQNRAMYNVEGDFAGVSIAVYVPLVITAHPSVPAANLKELVSYLQKEKGTRYTYGSTGPGSFMHVIGEALSRDTGIEMTHVPFKGAAPLKQELIAGASTSAATSFPRRSPTSSPGGSRRSPPTRRAASRSCRRCPRCASSAIRSSRPTAGMDSSCRRRRRET